VTLTTLLPSCVDYLEILGASTSWSTSGLFRPVMGLLYLSYVLISKMVLVILCFVDRASRYDPCKQPTIFHVCLFLFSTCFGQPCAYNQDNYCINATSGLWHSETSEKFKITKSYALKWTVLLIDDDKILVKFL